MSRQASQVLIVLQMAGVALLALWLLVLGRPIGISADWVWVPRTGGVVDVLGVSRLITPSVVFIVFAASALLLGRAALKPSSDTESRVGTRRYAALAVAAIVIGGFLMQWTAFSMLERGEFSATIPDDIWIAVTSTESEVSNEYFSTAYLTDDLIEFTSRYHNTMRAARYHVATHPPGAVLYYWVLIRVFEGSGPLRTWFTSALEKAAGADSITIREATRLDLSPNLPSPAVATAVFCFLATGLLGALAAVPIYLLGARFESRGVGLWAAGLWVITPSVVLFTGQLDQVISLGLWTALLLFVSAVHEERPGAALGAGVVFGAIVFISFGALAGFIVAVIFALLYRGRSVGSRLKQAGFAGFGLLVFWAATSLILRLRVPAIVENGLLQRHVAEIARSRSYVGWLGMNLVEFAVFLGWPVLVSGVWAVAAWVRRGRQLGELSPAACCCLAGVITLLLLNVSGVVRGEVGRIWMFLMPPLAVGAAVTISRDEKGGLGAAAMLFIVVQLFVLAVALEPLTRPV